MTDDITMRARAAEAARGWIGAPWRHQASLKGAGADCLGLVRGVWRELYGAEAEAPPPYGVLWAEETGRELLLEGLERHLESIGLDEAEAGDAVAFRFTPWAPAKHVAIKTGEDRMVHAWDGRGVVETTMGPWWRRRVAAAYRFPERAP